MADIADFGGDDGKAGDEPVGVGDVEMTDAAAPEADAAAAPPASDDGADEATGDIGDGAAAVDPDGEEERKTVTEGSVAASVADRVRRKHDAKADRKADILVGIMLVFSSVAVDMLGLSIILPVLPFYGLKFNASAFEIGLIFTAYALAQTISTPISGKLSDKFSRRTMILCSLLGSTVGFLFQAFSNSYTVFLIARFTAGAMGASVPIAMAFIADVTTQEERPRYMAFLGSIIGAAFLFGPGIGSGLSQFSLNAPMFVSAGLGGIGFVVSFFKLKDSKQLLAQKVPAPKNPSADKVAAGRERSGSGATRATDTGGMSEAEKKMARGYTILIAAAEFLNMSAFTAILTMSGLYAAEVFGFSTLELGFLFSGQSLVFVLVQVVVFPKLVAKVGKHGAGIIGCLVFTAGLLVIPLAGDVLMLVILGFVFTGSGYACVTPALPSLMSRYNEQKNQGSALGIGQSMQALARVLMPAPFGALYNVHITLPFYASAFFCVLNGVLLFAILQRNRRFTAENKGAILASKMDEELAITPKVHNEAARVDPERVRLLGQLTAELLVKVGYTAEQLNSEDGLLIALNYLDVSMDTSFVGESDVGDALRASTTTARAT